MLSVLIIDDEDVTRNGLKSKVNWEKLKIDKIYDSGDPIDALQIVEQVKPDIIISDMCMPGMNGVEMCSEIRKIHKNCQIIFLSGYFDKEYLKGAIKLEAVSYVEKPVSIKEIEDALLIGVEKQLQSKRKKERIRKLLTENNAVISKRLIEKMSMPNLKIEQLAEDFLRLNIDWKSKQKFLVILYKICPRGNKELETTVNEIRLEYQKISHVSCMKEGNYLVFVCAFGENETMQLEILCERIQNRIKKSNNQIYYCVVGSVEDSIETIYKSYQAAVIKMQQMYFWNRERFGFAKNLSERTLVFDEKIFEDFSHAIKKYSKEDALHELKLLYSFMQLQQETMISNIKGIYFRFVEVLYEKAGLPLRNGQGTNAAIVGIIWEKLHDLETIDDCQQYLEEETENYFMNVDELAEANTTIIRVISYIQSNYQDVDICLENIAENVYLSPNYLSGLFKKKMGKTISQYITEIRIQHAKELLRDRKLKLYDVAVKTGYRDANYFAKSFKKVVGVTPTEFREKYDV